MCSGVSMEYSSSRGAGGGCSLYYGGRNEKTAISYMYLKSGFEKEN